MTEREATEKLIASGSWLEGFNATRIRQSDGVIIDSVMIDPRLNPKVERVWVYFGTNQKWSGAEFDEHIVQRRIADWRFRRAQ